MSALTAILVTVAVVVVVVGLALSVRIVQQLGAFLAREQAAHTTPPPAPAPPTVPPAGLPAAVDQGANGPPAAGRH